MSTFYASYPVSGASVVTIYANVAAFPVLATTGNLAVDASTGNLYEFNGSAWVLIAGPGAALSLGNLDAQAATAQGAALTSGVLSMQSADATHPGLVNITTQSMAGAKTFTTSVSTPSAILTGTTSGALTLVAAATTTPHTLTMPSAQGAAYTALMNNGSGALSWTAPFDNPQAIRNYTITATVASNALTIALKTKAGTNPSTTDPVFVSFRSDTAALGTYAVVAITSALSIVVPSGATLGRLTDNYNWPLCVWLINNAGTAELAVSTSPAFKSVVNTTAISSGSSSAITVYSTSARSAVATASIAVLTINMPGQSTYTIVPTEIILTNGAFDISATRTASPLAFSNSALGALNNGTGMTIGANTQNSSSSLVIGLSSVCRQDNIVAIGNGADIAANGTGGSVYVGNSISSTTAATGNVAIGGAITSVGGDGGIAIGRLSSVKNDRAIAIGCSSGYSAATTGSQGSVAIGSGANPGAFTNAVLLTPGPSTANTVDISANNQLAFGSQRSSGQLTDVRFGAGGVANTNAANVTLGITGISGANATGKDLTIQAGNGTGSGGGGQLIFQTAPAAASSSTANTMTTRGGFNNGGGFYLSGTTSGNLTLVPAATTASYSLTLPNAQAAAASVFANDGAGATSWLAYASANTASTLVQRDGSGNFTATTITAALSGNATTATTAGNVSGIVAVVNGGTGRATLTDHGVLIGGGTSAISQLAASVAGTLLTGTGVSSDPAFSSTPTLGIAGTTLGTISLAGNTSGALTLRPAAATTNYTFTYPAAQAASASVLANTSGGAGSWAPYTDANTASAIVQRDGSGNFTATTITAALTGTASGNTTISAPAVHGVVVSGAANAMTSTAAGAAGTVLIGQGASSDPAFTATPTLGIAGTTLGTIALAGNTLGALTIRPAASTTSYTLTFPGAQGAASSLLRNNGSGTLSWYAPPVPTVQKFTSGSGTYTTPAGVTYITVVMVGGGGGGGGGGTTSGTAATAGGTSTFGTTLLSCNGGSAGARGANGAAGGTASLGTGPIGTVLTGGYGASASGFSGAASNILIPGGHGGVTAFGGAGFGGTFTTTGTAGDGRANTGAGGGGGGMDIATNAQTGAGGGSGGYVQAIITAPLATYAYAVGAGGTGQLAGTSGGAGGAGGAGYIEVTEYYT